MWLEAMGLCEDGKAGINLEKGYYGIKGSFRSIRQEV